MIVSKCPVRLSLVGGSTDLDAFLAVHGHGAVISFPCSLNTYISLHENHRNKFIVNCSSPEEVPSFDDIKNDVVRVAFQHFQPSRYLTVSFNSDIFSVGSGMASSSSYMIALIKALSVYMSTPLSDFDICKLALKLEREFNPLTGQQDTYGCGMMDFKRIDFWDGGDPSFTYMNSEFMNNFDVYLLYTGQSRKSTQILKTINVKKIIPTLALVDIMQRAIENNDTAKFCDIINEGWSRKKASSELIMANQDLIEMDALLTSHPDVAAHKLCGAGGGGHFAIFGKKGSKIEKQLGIMNKWLTRVTVSNSGLRARVI